MATIALPRIAVALAGWLALASLLPAPAPLAPALWMARDADTTVWLFGTVHRLRPGTPWLTGAVARAFRDSDTLVLELVAPTADEARAAMTMATPARPAPWPPALRAATRARAAALGFGPDAFERDDPWFTATSLAAAPLARAGYAAGPAPETLLATLAARMGKPVVGLEDQRGQLAMFAALPVPAQRAMLARVLATRDPVAAMDRVVAAWGAGDVAALAATTTDEMARIGPAARAALLDRRNARWAAAIAGAMAVPGTRFVAVGAGHLVGPGSVQARLRARGVAVVRIR